MSPWRDLDSQLIGRITMQRILIAHLHGKYLPGISVMVVSRVDYGIIYIRHSPERQILIVLTILHLKKLINFHLKDTF